MNLHDIAHRMSNIDLIAEYCTAYYAMDFRPSDDGRSLRYSSNDGRTWSLLPERDTLTYTNAALAWRDRGRVLHENE